MPFRKKGSQNWHYDFQVGGRRFFGSCCTADFEEAKAVEAQARVEARQGAARPTSFTISQALGTYWNDICQHQSSASTAQSQARALLKVLRKNTPIDELTNADLVRAVATMRAGAANATVNRRIDMLARAIRHMQRVHGATMPDLDFKGCKTREALERVREMSYGEQERLFAVLRPDLQPLVKLALLTGQRRAELCGLKWDDVNHETRRIHFRIKGGAIHRFPLSREIAALLSALPRSTLVRDRKFVLTYRGENGELRRIPASGGHVWELWRKALAKAEIDDFRFHDLRHTMATRMLRETGNIKLVSRLLGHSSIDTTSRYGHVLDDDLERAMDAFSGLSPAVSPAGRKIIE